MMFAKSFDRVAKRFKKCIDDLEVVETNAIDKQDDNQGQIDRLIKQNQGLLEEKRRASRMRVKLQEIVGD